MQRGLGEDAPVARPGRAATATGGFRMNHDNRDARLDAAMQQLHESAVDRVSGRPRLQLQQAPRTAPAASLARRSEERRAGNERVSTCRTGWSTYHEQKK